ncbi:MAG TPA: hypothetical protein VGT98_07440 [Candidatus Elarobacter sp.]|nr:hypothetical protein [Candidatus Elarobacter sp.]
MLLARRIRNFARLLGSRDLGYLSRYYWDRLRSHPATIARSASLDLRYARRMLGGDEPSRFGHLGARAVHHTRYDVLDLIFTVARPQRDDVLVDVGCGKGRVIIYWLHRHFGQRLIGLELDPDIAARTARQFRRFRRVRIIAGDAIENVPDDGTLFYLYNPFTEDKVVELERRLHALRPGQRVRVVYYNPNFLDAFPPQRWARAVTTLNGRLDRGTLQQFCFPVAVLDRLSPVETGTTRDGRTP